MIIYIFALIILAIVLVAHIFGLTGPYVTIFGYDIMMHVLGGIGIGLFVAAIIKMHGQNIINKRRLIIISVIVVGMVWELFEIYYKLTGYPLWTKLYYIDTVKDLIDDTIGALIVAYFVTKNKYKIDKENV